MTTTLALSIAGLVLIGALIGAAAARYFFAKRTNGNTGSRQAEDHREAIDLSDQSNRKAEALSAEPERLIEEKADQRADEGA